MFCWSRCSVDCLVKTLSTNFVCTFRKSYTVTTWTPITAYKPEYLSRWLNVIKENHVVVSVHLMVFNHDILLCLQFICVFLQRLEKWEYEGLCTKRAEKVKEYRNFIFCKFGTHFKCYSMEEKKIIKCLWSTF